MKQTSVKDKMIAAIGGAYSGTLIVTGAYLLLGWKIQSGVWWGWIAYVMLWGTMISTPLSIIAMFTVVRFAFKWLVKSRQPDYGQYALVGLVSGAAPILFAYLAALIYFLFESASLKEIASTLRPFFYFLIHGVLCGVLCLIILCKISANKPDKSVGVQSGSQS